MAPSAEAHRYSSQCTGRVQQPVGISQFPAARRSEWQLSVGVRSSRRSSQRQQSAAADSTRVQRSVAAASSSRRSSQSAAGDEEAQGMSIHILRTCPYTSVCAHVCATYLSQIAEHKSLDRSKAHICTYFHTQVHTNACLCAHDDACGHGILDVDDSFKDRCADSAAETHFIGKNALFR